MTTSKTARNFHSETSTSQQLDDGYPVTIKRRKFDDLFDETVIKRCRKERNVLKRRNSASSKEVITKKVRKKLKRMTIEFTKLQTKINAITGGRPRITIENYVDLEIPLINFNYVNQNVICSDIKIFNENPTSCDCGRDGRNSCFESRSCCCATEFNSQFAYNRKGKVIIPQGFGIYECSAECNCGPNCGNRVVQHGNTGLKLCVFKTANGRGWGVKTLTCIPKGTFVELIVGEVITSTEAVRREKIQMTSLQQSYLFDLDFMGAQRHRYSIDCFMYGNITRYINHSCMPNLGVYNVWFEHRDHYLPKLALFALKYIKKDEELTLDYAPQIGYQRKKVPPTNRANQIPCLCGTAKCRKFMWSK